MSGGALGFGGVALGILSWVLVFRGLSMPILTFIGLGCGIGATFFFDAKKSGWLALLLNGGALYFIFTS